MRKARENSAGRAGALGVALLSFALTLALCAGLVVVSIQGRSQLERAIMEQVILEKSLKVSEVVSQLLYKTQALAALVVQSDGAVKDFDKVAAAIVDDDAIMNVLIAPGGVVTEAYPEAGTANLIGFDFYSDQAGNQEAQTAIEKGELVFSGPFVGAQGRPILSGRLPVWHAGPGGEQRLWGIVAVTLKYPEALEGAGLEALELQGFAYEIWRTSPDTGQRQVIAHSAYGYDPSARYIERDMDILNARWHFRISPLRQWYQHAENWAMVAAGLCIALLVGFLVYNNARLRRVQRALARQEQIAREAAAAARDASQMKTDWLAMASHEMRTPLNSIVGYAELAAEDAGAGGDASQYIARIHTAARGLARILSNVLDIAKIEAGKMELEQTPFTVGEVLARCVDLAAPQLQGRPLRLECRDGAPRVRLLGDPAKLQQVLVNLLSNAIKFTAEGEIELACRQVGEGGEGVTLAFTVRDSGMGMSPEELARAMQPYAQAHSSTPRRFGGTGLGLPIAGSLVRLMGGELRAESRPGAGSVFSFEITLPAAEDGTQAPAEAEAPCLRPVFSARVLVCEDVAMNRELIAEQLRRLGIEPALAEDGPQGLAQALGQLAAGSPYDLVLTDVFMPGMDGMALARGLAEAGRAAPVVALTANVVAEDLARYRAAGMAGHLAKPVTAADLAACLLRYLPPVAWRQAPEAAQPKAPPAGEDAPIDEAVGLALVEGDTARYHRQLRRFAADGPAALAALQTALARGDTGEARRLAHGLKGMARLVGAGPLYRCADAMEATLAGSELPPAGQAEALARRMAAALERIERLAPAGDISDEG